MIETILHFWFKELEPQQWFVKDPELDAQLRQKFESTYQAIVDRQHEDWLETPEGSLAYILVLDQMARNMFRATPQAFAADPQALGAAQQSVSRGFDQQVSESKQLFFYMPYMHSEDPQVHQRAVQLFRAYGNPVNLEYEHKHKAIIDRFGRYPHRNRILGRESTPQEREFLKQPGSSF